MVEPTVPRSTVNLFKSVPLRRSSVVPNIVSALKAAGNNAELILRKAGIDPETLSDPYFVVRLDRVHLLFNLAGEALDDPNLGLKIGAQVEPRTQGLLGYILLNTPNLRTAIEDFIKYVRYFRTGLDLKLETSGKTATLTMTARDTMQRDCRYHSDCFITSTVTIFRAVIPQNWSPLEIHFQHHKPKNGVADYRYYFQCPIIFGQPLNAIKFPSSDLNLGPSNAEPMLYDYLKAAADQALNSYPKDDDLITRLRDMIVPCLQHGGLGIEEAAKGLGLSTRSLQRALAGLGTSFRQVTDDVRHRMATELLGNSDLSLVKIALLTGYSDSSAFNHAFRRWTGLTPLVYRQKSY